MPNTVKLYIAGCYYFSFIDSYNIECSKSYDVFNTFLTFSIFRHLTINLPFLPFYSPNPYRPLLVASYAPSDPPEPLFTSVFCDYWHRHRYRQILTSGEDVLASWNSAPAPAPIPPTTLVAHSNHGLCSFLLVNGMQVYNAQCDGSRNGNEGIAFLSFCGQLSRFCSACFDG